MTILCACASKQKHGHAENAKGVLQQTLQHTKQTCGENMFCWYTFIKFDEIVYVCFFAQAHILEKTKTFHATIFFIFQKIKKYSVYGIFHIGS